MKLNAKQLNHLVKRIIREEREAFEQEFKHEDFGNDRLEREEPEAYAALPSSYQNDSALTFYYDINGNLCAEHDLEPQFCYVWDKNKQEWVQGDSGKYFMESNKLTLSTVRKVIKEEVVRHVTRQIVSETIKRHIKLNETINFGALKDEIESAFDHFKAENPNIKVGEFNWEQTIKGLIQDPEARQMMKIGDADGLVNKALEIADVENIAKDVDVEKHAEDVFKDIQSDDDDKDIDAAFDRLTKKAS